jgi:pimeloyl-ACP methyl ester carboxylesterase
VAVDLRGHGLSSKPDGGYDFATVTRDLSRLVDQLGSRRGFARPPMMAGQSWGGNVVLDFAVRYPGVASGITLVDGGTIELSARFADWPTAEAALAPPALTGMAADQVEGWLRRSHPDWPEAGITGTLANMEVRADGTVRPWLSRDHHMQILRNLWEHRPRDLYPRVEVPALLVIAEDPSNARWMAGKREEVAAAMAGLRKATIHWVEGDHDLHAQHPGLVARLIHEATTEGPQ